VIVADTSVVIASALPWHDSHAAARAALTPGKTRLLAPVAVESYSVLTRLPAPHRVPAGVAWAYLSATFKLPPLTLAADGYSRLLARAAEAGIVGGAIYDAFIGAAAREAEATLLTLDRRAMSTYSLLGVDHQFLG
jgi:predicted nucleic acid-binding protein